jgi:hypothetical protein
MNALIKTVYEALLPLQIAVTRGFPQAIVSLPSITVEEKDNRMERDGEQVQALQIAIRAASPEQADGLAIQADAILTALQLRRTGCKDAAERDSGAYVKVMVYERRQAAEAMEPLAATLTLGTQQYEATLSSWERETVMIDAHTLDDALPRLVGSHLGKATLTLRLEVQALDAVQAALGQTMQVTPGTLSPLTAVLRGFRLRGGALEVTLDETLA